jgi:hypothetical protein
MGFGAGHIQDMNSRMKQNRELRPSNRQKFKGKNRQTIYSKSNENQNPLYLKSVSEKELSEIKKYNSVRAIMEQKRMRIIYGIFLLCTLIAIIGLLIWIQ